VFVDAGNAWTAVDGIDPGDVMYSVGWGVRWLSPMGPLRVEIGYPLRKREGDSDSVVSFSFGAPF
jgi:outer membrane protein insertion porin family